MKNSNFNPLHWPLKLRALWMLVLLASVSQTSFAQQPNQAQIIRGAVTSSTTNLPLAGKTVVVRDADSTVNRPFFIQVQTGPNGNYEVVVPLAPALGTARAYMVGTADGCNQGIVSRVVSVMPIAGNPIIANLSVCTDSATPPPPPPVCRPTFTWEIDTTFGNQFAVRFTNTSGCIPTIPIQYVWVFGNQTVNALNPVHIFPGPGTYTVCLRAIYNGRAETQCMTIVLGGGTPPPPVCAPNNRIFWRRDGNAFVFVSPMPPLRGFRFEWTLGDGSPVRNGHSVRHQYAADGNYQVCLRIIADSGNCVRALCDTILVRGNVQPPRPTNFYGLSGGVVAPRLNGSVVPYRVEAIGVRGTRFYRTATVTNDSLFFIDSLPAGNYIIRAMLRRNHPQVRRYLPTFFGQRVWWRQAQVVTVGPNTPNRYIPISLIPARALHRNRHIVRGRCSDLDIPNGRTGATNAEEPSTVVMLLDENMAPIEVSPLDDMRNYNFSELPAGKYYLSVEAPGIASDIVEVNFDDNVEAVTLNFSDNGTSLNGIATGLQNNITGAAVTMYPNPVKDQLTISGLEGAELQYTIFDATGKAAVSGTINSTTGSAQISTEGISKGVYMLQLQVGGSRVTRKLIKE